MLLSAFKKALDLLLFEFYEKVDGVLQVVDTSNDESLKAATSVLFPVVKEYREKTANLAGKMMREEVVKIDPNAEALVPEIPEYKREWLTKTLRESRSTKELRGRLGRHALSGARATVMSSVPDPMAGNKEIAAAIDDAEPFDLKEMPGRPSKRRNNISGRKRRIYPIGYARVLSGPKNCAFCVMLASRGPVYSSASHAGIVGKGVIDSPWAPTDQWPNSYHDNCDCLVVPVYSDHEDWLGKEAVEPLYKLYRQVTKGKYNLSASGGENEALDAWKEYIAELTEKGELLPVPEINSEEYREKVEAVIKKQKSEMHIDDLEKQSKKALLELEEHEQIFDTRFKAHGQTALWVPRPAIEGKPGQYAPSNDFYWVEKELQATELKTSKNKYSTISVRIKDAVIKAKNHEVSTIKENFIIDLGSHGLSQELRIQLSKYNTRNPNSSIRSLWVMHSDGKELEEIILK